MEIHSEEHGLPEPFLDSISFDLFPLWREESSPTSPVGRITASSNYIGLRAGQINPGILSAVSDVLHFYSAEVLHSFSARSFLYFEFFKNRNKCFVLVMVILILQIHVLFISVIA